MLNMHRAVRSAQNHAERISAPFKNASVAVVGRAEVCARCWAGPSTLFVCLFVVVFHRAQAGCAMLRLLVRGCALPVGYLARRSDGALEPLSWAQFG